MTYLEDNPHAVCPWPSCRCTHVGCVAGWIERRRTDDAGRVTDYVQPCPTCRPEVARHLADRSKTLRRLRAELPNLPRPTRGPRQHHQEELQ